MTYDLKGVLHRTRVFAYRRHLDEKLRHLFDLSESVAYRLTLLYNADRLKYFVGHIGVRQRPRGDSESPDSRNTGRKHGGESIRKLARRIHDADLTDKR